MAEGAESGGEMRDREEGDQDEEMVDLLPRATVVTLCQFGRYYYTYYYAY